MAVGLCAVQFGVGPVGVLRGGVRREHRNRSRTATILETSVSDRGTIKGLTQIRLFRIRPRLQVVDSKDGEMSEWLKEHAWKACVGETLPRVRIPLSPPSFVRLTRTP